MDRLLGSVVCTGVILIHTPPMGGTKLTVMPVVAHGGLELKDVLLGLFLGNRGGVAAVTAAAEWEPLMETAFNEVRKELISKYWVVVVAASWSRDAPMLVAAEARLSK